ncbi:MAG: hypothetical protein AB7V27_02240 [Candidatus Binatia bacterium]
MRHASALGLLAAWIATVAAQSGLAQHGSDMLIASSANGSGALVLDYDFPARIVVTESFKAGGITLYSRTEPGFNALMVDRPAEGLFALDSDTAVRCAITDIEEGASVHINGTTLDAIDETAVIGSAPHLHVHPIWRLTLPDGVIATRRIRFSLTGTRGYNDSVHYEAQLTNDPSGALASPTPSPTAIPPSPIHTASITPTAVASTRATAARTPSAPLPQCPGDCDDNGIVAVNEIIAAVNIALAAAPIASCPAIDRDGNQTVSVSELVRAVHMALSGCASG